MPFFGKYVSKSKLLEEADIHVVILSQTACKSPKK